MLKPADTLSTVRVSNEILRLRTKRHAIGTVTFGDVTFGQHLVAGHQAGGIAVVGVHPLVPQSVNRHGSGRTDAGEDIRQIDLKDFSALQQPRTSKLRDDVETFERARRIEMRIEAGRRTCLPRGCVPASVGSSTETTSCCAPDGRRAVVMSKLKAS